MDPIEQQTGIPVLQRAELRRLMAPRNGPGLARIVTQLAVLGGATAATALLAARGHLGWIAAMFVGSAALLALFPALHESAHGTAFRSAALNRATAWLGAVAMLQAPAFFREFHWQHHRKTQDRALDPELSGAPDLLDDWPRNPAVYLMNASGLALLAGKAMFTVACAVLPTAAAWQRLFPFVRAEKRSTIAWQSRLVVALLGGAVATGWLFAPGFGAVLLMWPVAHVGLGLYVMPEHTGLPNTGTQLQRTRNITSNRWLRWWMWNMPLHATHHAYPAVPFHALRELGARIEPSLVHVCRGYLAFHVEALRRAFWRRTDPS